MPGGVGPLERRAVVSGALLVCGGLVMLRLGFGPFEFRQGLLALLCGWLGCERQVSASAYS